MRYDDLRKNQTPYGSFRRIGKSKNSNKNFNTKNDISTQKKYNDKRSAGETYIDDEEQICGVNSSYLNIWEKIPSFKNVNIALGIIRLLIIVSILLTITLCLYFIFDNGLMMIIMLICLFILFLLGFRDTLFLTSELGTHKYGQIDPFKHMRFWKLKQSEEILFFSNIKDLIHCGIKLYKISVIPENIQPNLNHFIKSLHLEGIPFTYQVIENPILQNKQTTLNISVLFALCYKIKGILGKDKLDLIIEALDLFGSSFENACIANLAHFKIDRISNSDLIQAFQTFLFNTYDASDNDQEYTLEQEGYFEMFQPISILKLLFMISIIIFNFIIIGFSPIPFYWSIIINTIFSCFFPWIFWRELIYIATQFNFVKHHYSYQILNPFEGMIFYRFPKYKDTLFIHSHRKVLTALHFFNIKYVLPPQFILKNQFSARIEKFFRSTISTQIPFSYTLVSSPLSVEQFEREGLKHMLSHVIWDYKQREREYEREEWLDIRAGIWRILGIFTVQAHQQTLHLDELIIEKTFNILKKNSARFLNTFRSNMFNYKLEHLQGNHLFPALKTILLKSKLFRLNGSHLNYVLLQGKTLKNLMEISSEFKKGIETRLAAEFNAPISLKNFITIGNTINTEFLQEEVPVGFTREQLNQLLITNGTYKERDNLLIKLTTELVSQELPSIIFDYNGTFSKLIAYFEESRFQDKFLHFTLGRNFQIDPFTSDIEYDENREAYIDFIVDILAMVFKQRKQPMDALRELLKQEDYSFTEFLLDVKNRNIWEKNTGMEVVVSMLQQIKDVPSIISSPQDELFQEENQFHIYPYEFLTSNKTIILDLSIFWDLEPKVFIAFIVIAKILHYLKQAQDREILHSKIFIIPNCDVIFDNYFLDMRGDYRYGKIDKLLKPLQLFGMGCIITSNQIRYLHPNVFNYFTNIITFKATDKRDIAVLKNQMNLQELHGVGYYSSRRKDSYQIHYLNSLSQDEILMKRSDFLQPFPAKIHQQALKELKPLSQEQINRYMGIQGYNLEDSEHHILLNARKSLFEEHLKNYIIFLDEVIKFFSILQTLDSVGNLYKTKIKEELMKIIYPKVQKEFGKDKFKAKLIRDNLFETFLRYGYIIESHPQRASGAQSIRASYAVGPQYHESLEDYFQLQQMNSSTGFLSMSALEKESELSAIDFSNGADFNNLNGSIKEFNGWEDYKKNNNGKPVEVSNEYTNICRTKTQDDKKYSTQNLQDEFKEGIQKVKDNKIQDHSSLGDIEKNKFNGTHYGIQNNNAKKPIGLSTTDLLEIILDHSSPFFMKLLDISVYIDNKQYEEAVLLIRTALPTFLVDIYCDIYPDEENEMPELLIKKAALFLVNNIDLSLSHAFLTRLLEKCHLKDVNENEIINHRALIMELSDSLFEFFNSLNTAIQETIQLQNNKYYQEGYFEVR
ncbi:MAG: membrane protein of unknown function [Promethearchaeota archaeon]|nr:MAG: membrane protein of unknown function [Candidatus Lokiarchaeota archaeon]